MSFPRLMWTVMALTLVMGGATAATVRALPLDLSAIAQANAASRMEIRLAESGFTPGLREAVVSGSNERIYLYPTTLATWSDVTLARVVNDGNSYGVAVTFNSAAAGRMLGRPIYDRTNLTGGFDIQLEYTPDQMPQLPPGVTLPPGLTLPSPDGPSLSTALQEQLGLKLENTRGPVDVIVIDSVSQPEPD